MNHPLWHGIGVPDDFLVEGDGVRVRDRSGRWYLDGRSTLWHGTLGHNHPKVIAAIQEQLNTLALGTLLIYDRPAEVTVRFAEALAAQLPDGLRRIRFGNTGSQMTEAAVLLSRYHRRITGERDRTAVITLWGSYHGQGAGATPLSGMLADRVDWCGPLLPDVHHAQYHGSWASSIAKVAARLGPDRVTAVVIEPVMGTTGVLAEQQDLAELAKYCRDNGIHLVADEVSTGYGRVGALSRSVQLGVVPDMLVLAKGITAGYLPAAALVVNERIYQDLKDAEPFPHGSTTDGNPLAAAAGLAVLDVLFGDGLIDTVIPKGEVLRKALEQQGFDVAHAGLLQRVALPGQTFDQVSKLRRACEDNGLLVSAGLGCLCVLPPLVITEDDCREIAERLGGARG
ncbi:aspartate aminotransferase family protein [Lentzea sp. NBRC 105346]|uniref:aminotransferase class III-fold pyridoxal phosphate-dependent enzyme n=1 Tax=Lentzea sp. NBRC 105346 TaxID=3032205 RepID=UPI0024A24C68|nr:aminotransferase class III-fold pyridoxal phosphate-dependent enzyme [Lentzea sp. NBRC 105346]GLZ28697.1 aspartate aminotransferase family protein [Lentzea sp. NBRC 105346]